MDRQRVSLRSLGPVPALPVVIGIALAALLAVGQRPAYTDDVDLLRFTTAKPYVFFLLDNSASMAHSPDGQWVHGNGDDPRSKLYQAKKVVYEVFRDVNDIHFGFAAYNQDYGRVLAKHWLYYYVSGPSNQLPNDWPINYPAADNDGPIGAAADGTVTSDIDGDLVTFGTHLEADGILGTCPAPYALGTIGSDTRELVNRFAWLGTVGNGPTYLWLQQGGKTYRLKAERPLKKSDDLTDNPQLGQNNMDVRITLEEIRNNGCIDDQSGNIQKTWTARLTLTLWTDFLLTEEANGRLAPSTDKAGGVDSVAGFWTAQDFQDASTCGSGHPFSGLGWEGNYDTVPVAAGSPQDPYCKSTADSATCTNLKRLTVADPLGRALDKGDLLPFDWRTENKSAFLQRFAPNHGLGTPDFRIASYFKKDADSNTGALPLVTAGQIPIYASGPSPLSKAVVDFRCWYMGEGNKCKESAYTPGWEDIAASKDSEWGCRRPYLIVLSDGGDSCAGENPCADVASLNSHSAVRTWVIAYGKDCTKVGNPLKCMATNGKGELLCPKTANELKSELLRILGLIRQEARAFASAAVPSVQAIVEDKIFLTNFTPLNEKAIWDGHVHSFLKPLPLRSTDSKPDTSHPNHVWDAGEVLVNTQVDSTDPTGPGAGQRRVYYARESTSSDVPFTKRFFEVTDSSFPNDVRYDLWRGLGYSFTAGDVTSEATAETAANQVVTDTFTVKTAVIDVKNPDGTTTPTTIRYLLGDIFHSNPLVMGNPPNTQYYALDLHGYQEFAEKHRLRRKMLLVGANDGMLHAFDAGKYSSAADKFDNGTGKELFGYIPRSVLPTVRDISSPTATLHQWSVDGTVVVSDAFIDPRHSGTPNDSDREWRTVAVGGLRQGGAMYYALDITQPDILTTGDDPGEDHVPQPDNGYVPSCLAEGSFTEAQCGPVPFPSVLWEFDDKAVTASGTRVAFDEDNNDSEDLGDTWSTPNLGRIRIAESAGSATTRDVYVAVFGGGLDPNNKTNPARGNFIYVVDLETGKAIYKRRVDGGVPSEPAAVDTNSDGYLDRIYFGTTQGFIYRVDLVDDIVSGSDRFYPALETQTVNLKNDASHQVLRIPTTSWKPYKIFNASTELGTATAVPRPFFFRPSVVFDAKLGSYLLAVGTGDRDDLWNNDGLTGRFFVFADDSDQLAKNASGELVDLPDETHFTRVQVNDTAVGGSLETGTPGERGWYLVLAANERVINEAFALSGVTFFSTFQPNVNVTATKEGPQCSKTGVSRVFIVNTLNADPFVQPPSGVTADPTRAFEVPNFVTNPFAEQGQTKNDGTGVAEICDDPTKMAIMDSLKSLFPPTCKFSTYRVDIKTIAADTSLVCIAPVPVCLIQKNWKEF